jgi:phage head maturation protease
MELEVDGTSLNGKVSLGDGRWMVLEEGTIDGSSFHFTVTRDRDGGGSMSYKLSGTLADGKLSGTATTKLGENEISSRWGAVRKQ